MIVEFSILDTEDFAIEHIFDSSENEKLISEFSALNGAEGLENYLKIRLPLMKRICMQELI